jgi:hypothetical protein
VPENKTQLIKTKEISQQSKNENENRTEAEPSQRKLKKPHKEQPSI